jgi:predicted Zn-dependent peptidase
MSLLRLCLMLALSSIGLRCSAVAQNAISESASGTPLRGTLPNGVSYVVLPHASIRGELSVRLVVQAGSLDEHDDERGFAHLIQHLAIDSVSRLASPEFRAYASRFAPESPHAAPSYTHTTHAMDLTLGGAGQVDHVMRILRQVADGLSFSSENIARVVPVVARELEPPSNRTFALAQKVDAAFYAGTDIPDRNPNVASDLPGRSTAEKVSLFYRRTYRANRMTVVVVGPVDGAVVVAKIGQHFDSLAASDAASPARPVAVRALAGIKPAVFELPDAPPNYAAIEIVSVRPREDDTAAGRRKEFIQAVAMAALTSRLNFVRAQERFPSSRLPDRSELTNYIMDRARLDYPGQTQVLVAQPGQSTAVMMELEMERQRILQTVPPIATGEPAVVVYRAPPIPSVQVDGGGTNRAGSSLAPGARLLRSSIRLSAFDGDWEWLLKLAQTELRRLRNDGFSTDEVADAVASQMAGVTNRLALFEQMPAENLADDIAQISGEGRTWRSPVEYLPEARLAPVESAELVTAITEQFPGDASHVMLFGSSSEPDRLLNLYSKYAKIEVSRRDPITRGKPEFDTLPPKSPTQKSYLPDLDLTLASYANGVKVNFRPGKFDGNRFRLCMVFPQSWAVESPKTPGLSRVAAYGLLHGPFREHDSLDQFFLANDIRAEFVFESGSPVLFVDAPSEQLELVLRTLHARFVQVNWSYATWRSVVAQYATAEKRMAVNPGLLAFESSFRLFAGGDKRIALLPPTQLPADTLGEEAGSWLRKFLLEGPLEIGVVGDLSPDRVIEAANASFAKLRQRAGPLKSGSPFKATLRATRQEELGPLPRNVGVACVQWPTPAMNSAREDAAVDLATYVLRERLASVVRDGFGAACTVELQPYRNPAQPDLGFVKLIAYFPPALLKQFTDGSLRLAAKFAQNGVTAEEAAAARAAALMRVSSELKSDQWWLREVVAVAQSRPAVLATARTRRSDLEGITLAEVNAAAKIFSSERVTVLELRPSPPSPSPSNSKSTAK